MGHALSGFGSWSLGGWLLGGGVGYFWRKGRGMERVSAYGEG